MTDVRAVVIPVVGPVKEVAIPSVGALSVLQDLVNGWIEAIGVPSAGQGEATAYVNEEGKLGLALNRRATDFLGPGVGLRSDDWIAGSMVLVGFDPETGEHRDLPEWAIQRARLIEREATIGERG